MKPGTGELLSIGRFSRVSGLTVKALRHYDEIGLLEPARTDSETGYRYYALAQAREADAIRRLRSLEVPLDEIAELVRAPSALVRERLVAHRSRIEGRAVETRRILAELQALIDGKEQLVPDPERFTIKFELDIKEVPERHVVLERERGLAEQMSEIIPRLIEQVGERVVPAGPPVCVCPFPGDDGTLEVAVGWPVPADTPGAERLPATRALVMTHHGPYERLSHSYRLMSEVMERNGLEPAGDPVEVYVTDAEEVPDPKDYVTEIEWPIGPGGELTPPGEDVFFERRIEHR